MLKLSTKSLSQSDSDTVSELLHTIGDFERIGDHAINIVEISKDMKENELSFSKEAIDDFVTLFAALTEISELADKAFINNDTKTAEQVEPLEEVIDDLTAAIKSKHIARLRSGKCRPELGVTISDILINCERVSDHYSNIAVSVIETAQSQMYNHSYPDTLKNKRSPIFIESYGMFSRKYRLAAD